MRYLKIKNAGELDVRLISLMGGSTKEGNETKIGRFGTGLKYSLSYLIRNNIDFKVFIGEKEVSIHTETENIGNRDFEILYIGGERTSITASMGLDWEGWMIVREIYCNALDEGECEYSTVTETQMVGYPDTTTFYIQEVGQIKETVDKWSDYFVNEVTPLHIGERFRLFPASEHLKIYKQGILIHQDKDYKSMYSYDLTYAELNELREYTGYLFHDLARVIGHLPKDHAELFMAGVNDKMIESKLDYDYVAGFGDQWSEAIGQAKIIAKEDFDAFVQREIITAENKSHYIVVPRPLFKVLTKHHKHVSAVRVADKLNAFFETVDEDLKLKIKSALAILETCGYRMDENLTWIIGSFGDPKVWAQINFDEKVIMFSQELGRKSMFDIVTTVIEENEHFLSGYKDCTREFQQHFIDLYARQILDRNGVTL